MELDLGEIRKNIDAIDDQLLELFKQRMGLTRKVAEYKAAHNMVVFQSEREKAIILMRFGLSGSGEYTQKEVADMMGISQSYISRLEKKIIDRLRREMLRQMQC